MARERTLKKKFKLTDKQTAELKKILSAWIEVEISEVERISQDMLAVFVSFPENRAKLFERIVKSLARKE